MKAAVALTIFSSIAVSARAEACDAFCDSVKQIIAARDDNFSSLRSGEGEKTFLGRTWKGSLTAPQAEACEVNESDSGFTYACRTAKLAKAAATKLYARLLAQLAEAVPHDWIQWKETQLGGGLFLAGTHFGPDKDHSVVTIDLSSSPRIVHVTVAGAPK